MRMKNYKCLSLQSTRNLYELRIIWVTCASFLTLKCYLVLHPFYLRLVILEKRRLFSLKFRRTAHYIVLLARSNCRNWPVNLQLPNQNTIKISQHDQRRICEPGFICELVTTVFSDGQWSPPTVFSAPPYEFQWFSIKSFLSHRSWGRS